MALNVLAYNNGRGERVNSPRGRRAPGRPVSKNDNGWAMVIDRKRAKSESETMVYRVWESGPITSGQMSGLRQGALDCQFVMT